MTNRAYADLVQSGIFSYARLIERIDDGMDAVLGAAPGSLPHGILNSRSNRMEWRRTGLKQSRSCHRHRGPTL
jgi:hypothetical protein